MVAILEAVAALAGWTGAATLVLFEGSRANAVGLVAIGAALALGLVEQSDPAAAGIVLGGSVVASIGAWRAGHVPFMTGPTTPRVVLAILAAAGAVWLALFALDHPGSLGLRVTLLVPLLVLGAALLGPARRGNVGSVAAALTLTMSAVAAASNANHLAVTAGAVTAVLVAWAPRAIQRSGSSPA